MDRSERAPQCDLRADEPPEGSWDGTRVQILAPLDARIAAILDTWGTRRCFGAQFRVLASPAVDWHLQHGTLDRTSFFRDFFTDPAVAGAIPGLTAPAIGVFPGPTLGLRYMGT